VRPTPAGSLDYVGSLGRTAAVVRALPCNICSIFYQSVYRNSGEGEKSVQVREEGWAVVEEVLGQGGKLGRPPRFERRAVLGAIFYMVRTGGS